MAVLYFAILADTMKEIMYTGSFAESTLKAEHIINYYSRLKQYFITLSPVLSPDEIDELKAGFEDIGKKLFIKNKYVRDDQTVVLNLQEIQEELYNKTQQRKMLLPMSYEKSKFAQAERKLGVRV